MVIMLAASGQLKQNEFLRVWMVFGGSFALFLGE